ncbi:hypothetical protein RF11_07797 [Thelohanellus kitauei]|uniref:Uncharacterized protein n=1 Tax=Thelohanellus kitauei TaxID=669202 RepID=A0A0C2JY57_THEKT|nr:hypothetical protein RF11_07797 [Thelohanellus kitauei]
MEFTSDGSQFIVEFEEKDARRYWCNITCKFNVINTELEISECHISLSKQEPSTIRHFSIGLRYKFNKYTNYQFPEYRYAFTHDEIVKKKDESFESALNVLNIQFQDSNQICKKELPKNEYISMSAKLDSTDEIYPCKPNFTANTTEYISSASTRVIGTTLTTPSSTIGSTTKTESTQDSTTRESTTKLSTTSTTEFDNPSTVYVSSTAATISQEVLIYFNID